MAGIPDEMPDAVAQMVEQRRAPAEQQYDPEPRAEKILHGVIGVRTARSRDEPPHEQYPAEAQGDAGGAVEDRHHRCELPAVNLKVRRQRPLGGSHPSAFFGGLLLCCKSSAPIWIWR